MVAKLLYLVPSFICNPGCDMSLDEVTSFYADDLPNSALVPMEAWRWRAKWQAEDTDHRPSTLVKALQQ
jgi:hypothetical protein